MANAPEIRRQLDRLLERKVSLDAFEDWFVPYSWNIHKHGDREAQQFAYAIERLLSEFDEDSEDLRKELANAGRPFAPKPEIVLRSAIPQKVSVFEKSMAAREVGSDSKIQIEHWLCA